MEEGFFKKEQKDMIQFTCAKCTLGGNICRIYQQKITSADMEMGLTANCVMMCESINQPNARSVEKGL